MAETHATGDAIADRLRLVIGAESDAVLSRALDISPATVSSWRNRDSRPYALCIEIAEARGLSLDWLLLGRGPMRSAACEYPAGEDRPDGRLGVNDVDHGGEVQDPADLAAIIAWARAWHAGASPEERAWLRVQLRRAIPELADYLDHQDSGPI